MMMRVLEQGVIGFTFSRDWSRFVRGFGLIGVRSDLVVCIRFISLIGEYRKSRTPSKCVNWLVPQYVGTQR